MERIQQEKPKCKQGRSKAKRIKEIRLQVERNQVMRKDRQAVKEIRLQLCSGHDNQAVCTRRELEARSDVNQE